MPNIGADFFLCEEKRLRATKASNWRRAGRNVLKRCRWQERRSV